MATIQKRPQKNGTIRYRVMIRQSDGFPPVSKTFPTKQEAKDWSKQEEARRRQGYGPSDQMKGKQTLTDLIDRYTTVILPTKPKDARNMKRHLEWWRDKIGKYGVAKISPDLIAQCRQQLTEGTTSKKTKRSPATVNRYLASLSTVMSYGVRECGWIIDNPCLRVAKFNESKGRDRIVSCNEFPRLLEECKNSRNEHLLPIVLLAITTGMRRGEIVGLTWDCIDLDRQIINLKETKNGKPRTVSIVGQSLELLRSHYSKRNLNTPFVFPAKLFDDSAATTIKQFCADWKTRQMPEEANSLDLLIIDTLHTATVGADENSAQQMGKVLHSCRWVANELGCAVILVHHTNKTGAMERGSSALRGAMDFMIKIEKASDTATQGVMSCEKLKDGEQWKDQSFSLCPQIECGSVYVSWNEPDNPKETKGSKINDKEKLKAEMKRYTGKRLSCKSLAEAIAKKENYTRKLLNELENTKACQRELSYPEKDQSNRNPWVYWIDAMQEKEELDD